MVRLVVLREEVVDEAGEDSPPAVVAELAVADGDERRRHGAHARPRAPVHDEAVDHDVRRAFEVDPSGGRGIVRGDLDGRSLGAER
jgi:hypothetical protein